MQIRIIGSKPLRGRKPAPIQVSVRQRIVLQRLSRRQTAAARLVLRARLILLADDAATNTTISKQLALDRGQVRLWRSRWLAATSQLLAVKETDPTDQQLTTIIESLLTDE